MFGKSSRSGSIFVIAGFVMNSYESRRAEFSYLARVRKVGEEYGN